MSNIYNLNVQNVNMSSVLKVTSKNIRNLYIWAENVNAQSANMSLVLMVASKDI